MKQVTSIILAIFVTAAMAIIPAVSVAAVSRQDYRYVALGDSVSAGFGLPVTSTGSEDILCARSPEAYPQQLANYYQISVENLSCAGAKVDEGIYGMQERGGQELQPQLDAAFAGGVPDLMTMTIGANDLRWSQFVAHCYQFECGDSRSANLLARAYLTDLRIELTTAMKQIKQRSNGHPPLAALSGYYNPFGSGTCADTYGVTSSEAAWLGQRVNALNSVIEDVASHYQFTTFVPVDFSGHELCSSDPWVQGPSEPGAFHPTSAGQTAIASSFIRIFNY